MQKRELKCGVLPLNELKCLFENCWTQLLGGSMEILGPDSEYMNNTLYHLRSKNVRQNSLVFTIVCTYQWFSPQ